MLRRELDGGLHGSLEDFVMALRTAADSLSSEQRARWDACVRHAPGSEDLMLRLDFVDEREELIERIVEHNHLTENGRDFLYRILSEIYDREHLPRLRVEPTVTSLR